VRAYWHKLQGDAGQDFRFLHVSTDEVNGALAKDDPTSTEAHPYEPNINASNLRNDLQRFKFYPTHHLERVERNYVFS